MNFKNLPTALKVELKTCNIVLVRTFHKASKIIIARTISMIITAVIVHICAQQSKTYFTAVRAGVFCVISMQVSYPDTSLVCGKDPRMCEVLPEVLPNTSRVLDWSGLSRLDEGSLRALGQRTIQKKMSGLSEYILSKTALLVRFEAVVAHPFYYIKQYINIHKLI